MLQSYLPGNHQGDMWAFGCREMAKYPYFELYKRVIALDYTRISSKSEKVTRLW